MRSRDRPDVLELIREAHESHRRGLRSDLKTVRPESAEAVFGPLLDMDRSVYFVAESARRVVGYIHCELRSCAATATLRARKFAYVNRLVVARDARRQGVGRQLMELVHEWALGKEVTEIELDVFEFNGPALALYEELGYDVVSRRMRFEL